MPDNFQDYSYLSYPSPSGSSDSQSSNGDATSAVSSGTGFTEWARDYNLDALYSPEFMDDMMEQEFMECLANLPAEGLFPDSQTIHPGLLQGFPHTQNVQNSTSSTSIPMMAQPNPFTTQISLSAASTQSAGREQQFFASPPQAYFSSRQLPPLRPVMLPTSPSSQASLSSSVGPPGDTQRLSLPAPGDMNCSSCEVIM
ncbi:unnamed protein product [Rhizoctonia solani]|uniref:Uncharacterized protein n=1 Tax=Rhizoctonia solani TaxID=456999 RepID=A0A8H3A8E7_9AGAM|nr:unnamed protein product [Rhizoctonia solani]